MNSIQDLSAYLTAVSTGDETAELGVSGGFINFSNSGKRGGVKKEFTLSLESILTGFQDIESHISAFATAQNYAEAQWRDLGSKFTDAPLFAMVQVQTKPVFILFSKIIFWATGQDKATFSNEKIDISPSSIQTTINKLNQVISAFSPSSALVPTTASTATSGALDTLVEQLHAATKEVGLTFSESQIKRLVAAQITKPFVILTGLSGSGKTKLAEALAYWLSATPDQQVCMVAVGADWTNNEPLLGYADAINKNRYCAPASGILQLLDHAQKTPKAPHFLILDEMNLSHVERYFADFLSAMESSKPELALHGQGTLTADDGLVVPARQTLPPNVFIIGTVNVDETTYMFSPKVLDRANVIEFRVEEEQMRAFLGFPFGSVNIKDVQGQGAHFAEAFVAFSKEKFEYIDIDAVGADYINSHSLRNDLMDLFKPLAEVGAEFGFRNAREMALFMAIHDTLSGKSWQYSEALDAIVMQKLMPKLHGSARKLNGVLDALEKFADGHGLPMTQDKVKRMKKRLKDEGFTSFAEN